MCLYWKDKALLQSIVVKRIERVYRLRMLFVLHLALYGLALIVLTAVSLNQPLGWIGLLIAVWLPLLLTHAIFQSLYELRERCAYQPQLAGAFRPALRPVDLYDEQGNPVGDEQTLDFLPRTTRQR